MAQAAHDEKGVNRVVQECFGDMTHKLMAVANSYDFMDLPFVLATMRLTAQAMTPLLDENGRQLMENLVSHTSCVTIDADELRRQAEGNDKNGGDNR